MGGLRIRQRKEDADIPTCWAARSRDFSAPLSRLPPKLDSGSNLPSLNSSQDGVGRGLLSFNRGMYYVGVRHVEIRVGQRLGGGGPERMFFFK